MKTRKRKYDISYEAAENELAVFLDHYDIYPDDIVVKKDRENLKAALEAIIIHIRAGRISFVKHKDGQVDTIQKLENTVDGAKNVATYKSTDIARAKVQMKDNDEKDYYGRMYALMGSLSGNGSTWIENKYGVDHKAIEALSILFLQCTSG
jgi:hypothetical protein